jgi:hypothetical protein
MKAQPGSRAERDIGLLKEQITDSASRELISTIFGDNSRIVYARGDAIEVDDDRLSKVVGESYRLFGIISSEDVAARALLMMRAVVRNMDEHAPEYLDDSTDKTAEYRANVNEALIYIISFINNQHKDRTVFLTDEILEACASVGIKDKAVIQLAVYRGLEIGAFRLNDEYLFVAGKHET